LAKDFIVGGLAFLFGWWNEAFIVGAPWVEFVILLAFFILLNHTLLLEIHSSNLLFAFQS